MKRPPALRRRTGVGSRHLGSIEVLESRRLLTGAASAFGQIPLSFEVNQGQTNSQVQFLARGGGYALFITPTTATLSLQSSATAATALRMQLVGANAAPQVVGLDPLAGVSNYLASSDSSQWHTNIAHYGEVAEQGVYPGVNLVYYGNQQQLEYDFQVAPGADPSAIKLAFQGQQAAALDAAGNLVLHTASGDVVEQAPVVYQTVGGIRRAVSSSYTLGSDGQVGFALGAYNKNLALVIDPVLGFSTLLGSNTGTEVQLGGMAVDAAGNTYITGYYAQADYPTTTGAYQTTGGNLVVTKLDPTGTALVYSTYLGGSAQSSIAVDATGNVYLTGYAGADSLPTTPGAFQPASTNTASYYSDAFVTKLNPTGTALVYSTFLGGSNSDQGNSIAVDAAGNAFVTGTTSSTDFPTTAGAFQTTLGGGGSRAFVTEVNPTGTALVYSTLLGGTGGDGGDSIALDTAGEAFIAGSTSSTDFPTTAGAFQPAGAGLNYSNVFVAKLNAGGSALVYATLLGGKATDSYSGNRSYPAGIAVDGLGNAYVTGSTTSPSFPTTPGAFQTAIGPPNFSGSNTFLTKLNPTGSGLVYSSFLSGGSSGRAITIDAAGDAYLTGTTDSTTFPTVNAFQTTYGGGFTEVDGPTATDAYVAEFDPAGSGLLFSSYLGGANNDYGYAIAVNAGGDIYVGGFTSSTNFPTTPGAFDRSLVGTKLFVAKIIPSVQFSAAASTVAATDGSVVVTVTRTGSTSAAATVMVATADGTGVQGLDYQAVQQTLTFGVGVASQQVTIPILNRGGTDPTARTFNLTLTNPTGDLGLGLQPTALVTINERPAASTTTLTVTASSTSSAYGRSVSFTAQVAPVAGSTGAPTGTVTFLEGTTVLGTAPLDPGTGLATFATTTLGLGSHTITAVYGGDASFGTSTGSATQVVTLAGTITTLTSATIFVMIGQPITLTYQVVDPEGNPVPNGTIQIEEKDHPERYSFTTTVVNGVGSVNVTLPIGGTHYFNAIYTPTPDAAGNPSPYLTSTSNAFEFGIRPTITTATLVPTAGQPVTFSSIVSTADPAFMAGSDNVIFDLDNTPFGVAAFVRADANNQLSAFYTFTGLAAGPHTITATYNGSSTENTGPVTSEVLSFNVVAGVTPTTTTLISSAPTGGTAGQPIVFTATVDAHGAAQGALTGSVIFTINGVALPAVALIPSPTTPGEGFAQTVYTPRLEEGLTVTATYSGDAANASSSSAAVAVPIVQSLPVPVPVQVASITNLASVTTGFTPGQPFVLIATVYGATVSQGIPTGMIQFFDGTTSLGLIPLDFNGQAVFFIPALAAGPHQFVAVYSSDPNYLQSIGSLLTFAPTTPAPLAVTDVVRADVGNPTTDVLIGFNATLATARAQTVANYRVITPNGRLVRIRSADYDPNAGLVTLELATRLNSRVVYRLRVIGSGRSAIRGVDGQLLAGAASGKLGTNYQGTIPRALTAASVVQAQTTTVTHPQGRLAAQHHAATRLAQARAAR